MMKHLQNDENTNLMNVLRWLSARDLNIARHGRFVLRLQDFDVPFSDTL